MEWKFLIPLIAILVVMVMALVRAFLGPTSFDRILAGNMFSTKIVLLIAVAGFLEGRPEWLDLALVYAMMNFIGVYAILRYARYGSLAHDERMKEE